MMTPPLASSDLELWLIPPSGRFSARPRYNGTLLPDEGAAVSAVMGRPELYTQSMNDLFSEIQQRSDIELSRILLEAMVRIGDGLHALATVCPTWAYHHPLRPSEEPDAEKTVETAKNNLTFHQLAVHDSKSLCQIFSYFALLRDIPVKDNRGDVLCKDEKQLSRVLDVLMLLDTVRTSNEAFYVPLPQQTLKASIVASMDRLSELASPPDGTSLLQMLTDIRTALEKAPGQWAGLELSESTPADPAVVVGSSSPSVKATVDSANLQPSSDCDTAQSDCPAPLTFDWDDLVTCLKHVALLAAQDMDCDAFSSPLLDSHRPRKRPRVKDESVRPTNRKASTFSPASPLPSPQTLKTSQGSSPLFASDSSSSSLDLSSPCQGVCWDPTHQRWVAHWSDAKTHQRIRRYFNPKAMGFNQARLLAVLTRKEAVESGRASMITKGGAVEKLRYSPPSDASSPLSPAMTHTSADEGSRGLYWCPVTSAWYCHWKLADSEEIHVRCFSVADYMKEADGDFRVAVTRARSHAIDCRNSVAVLLKSPSAEVVSTELNRTAVQSQNGQPPDLGPEFSKYVHLRPKSEISTAST